MTRGRKGANDGARRPLVKPVTLTDEQSRLWDYTVESQSSAWQIPGMEPLLHDFVVTACMLRALYARRELELVDPDSSVAELETLGDLINLEGRKLQAVMTKLRLTPQSRTKETGPRDRPLTPFDIPLDDDEEDDMGDTE